MPWERTMAKYRVIECYLNPFSNRAYAAADRNFDDFQHAMRDAHDVWKARVKFVYDDDGECCAHVSGRLLMGQQIDIAREYAERRLKVSP